MSRAMQRTRVEQRKATNEAAMAIRRLFRGGWIQESTPDEQAVEMIMRVIRRYRSNA